MYRVWYWAMVDRETDGRFIASIPDLGDLAAYGENEKDAVAHVAELAANHSTCGERARTGNGGMGHGCRRLADRSVSRSGFPSREGPAGRTLKSAGLAE